MKKIIYTLTAIMLSIGAWAENVAKIDEVGYETLQDAVTAAQAGQTVTLTADVQLSSKLEVNCADVTLDLNGHTISPTADNAIHVYCIVMVHRGAKLTVDDSSAGMTGCIDGGNDANAFYGGIQLTQAGDAPEDAKAILVVNKGNIKGNKAAITGNGNRHNTEIVINGGNIVGYNSTAIYQPQIGTLTINGGNITGKDTAVEIRSGELTITGGTLTATADAFSCNPNGDGTTTVGAAVAIAQHTTKKDIGVNISGGTFNGVKAINESNPQVNDPAPLVTMAVTGGTFKGEITTVDVNNFISGGTFKEAVPESAWKSGFVPVKDAEGNYVIVEGTHVAEVGGDKFISLASAVAAATTGQTITLLEDITLTDRIEPNKDLTIDLNGKTITTTATCGNGSAFDVKAGTVTIQNGTIDASFGEANSGETDAITARSGANVTLQDLNITVNSKNGSCAYAFEGGHITIKSGTYENQTTEQYEWNANFKALVVNQANVATQLVTIKGGTFIGQDPSDGDDSGQSESFLPEDLATQLVDGKFEIVPAVARIGVKGYATFAAALAAATADETITLLADAEIETIDVVVGKTIAKNEHEVIVNTFEVVDFTACNIPFDFTAKTATYTRSVAGNEWGTVCVPFTLKTCDDYTLYKVANIADNVLHLTEVTEAAPGTPVIFSNTAKGASLTFSTTNAAVSNAAPVDNAELVGTYTQQTIESGLENIYYINGDAFHQAKASLKVPAYRAYINYTAGGAKPAVLSLFVGDDEATGVESVSVESISVESVSGVYDMNGRSLAAPQKGLNIVKLANGKTVKLIIK